MLPDCRSSDCLWATEEGAKHQAAQGSSHTIRQERSCRKTCTYYSLQGSEPSFSVFWERASCYWKNEVDEQVAITACTQKGAGEEICLLGLALCIFIFQSSEDREKIRQLNLSEMKNIFFLQMSLLPCFEVNSNVPPPITCLKKQKHMSVYRCGWCWSISDGLEIKSQWKEWYFL